MRKDYFITLYTFMINSILAVWCFKSYFYIDKLTTIMIILVLLIPAAFDLIIQNEFDRLNKDLKEIKIKNNYFIISIIMYLLVSFLLALNINIFNIVTFSIAIILLILANNIRTYSKIKYSKKIIIYKNKAILREDIKKIRLNENILNIELEKKDNSIILIKFKNIKDLKEVYITIN